MANLTQQNWLDRIYWEVSGQIPTGPALSATRVALTGALQAQLQLLWQMAGVEASVYAGTYYQVVVQYLKTKLAAIDVMLGYLSAKVDGMIGRVLRVQGSQLFNNMLKLRSLTAQQLDQTEAAALMAVQDAPTTAPILQTAPEMGGEWTPPPGVDQPVFEPDGPFDPGYPGLYGDPNYPPPETGGGYPDYGLGL